MSQPTVMPTLPSEAESALARETSTVLASRIRDTNPLRLRIMMDRRKELSLCPSQRCGCRCGFLRKRRPSTSVFLIELSAYRTQAPFHVDSIVFCDAVRSVPHTRHAIELHRGCSSWINVVLN